VVYDDIGRERPGSVVSQSLHQVARGCDHQCRQVQRDLRQEPVSVQCASQLPLQQVQSAFGFSTIAEVERWKRSMDHVMAEPILRFDFLVAAWAAVLGRDAPFVWVVEADVALLRGNWLSMLRTLDETLPDVDYVHSSAMPLGPLFTQPEHLGTVSHFLPEKPSIEHFLRRAEHWVVRFSPRFMRSMRAAIQRGLTGWAQLVYPTLCAAWETNCTSYTLKHGVDTFPPLWSWSPSCGGLRAATFAQHQFAHQQPTRPPDTLRGDSSRGNSSSGQGRFAHPFKWDVVLDHARYARYATELSTGGSGANDLRQPHEPMVQKIKRTLAQRIWLADTRGCHVAEGTNQTILS